MLVAGLLYCKIPFKQITKANPEIIQHAQLIGRTTAALYMKMANISHFDPNAPGIGLPNTGKADEELWNRMSTNWNQFMHDAYAALQEFQRNVSDSDIPPRKTQTRTERPAWVNQRVGQQYFREIILGNYQQRCCISGLSHPKLLVAGHIVPWGKDMKQRLNPRNGLCLSILHEKAFDRGIITLDENLRVMVSKEGVEQNDVFYQSAILDYEGKSIEIPEKLGPEPEFLAQHREEVFEHWGKS